MRRKTAIVAVLALCLLAGCNATPGRRLDQGLNVYAATLDALSDLRQAGYIDDATQRQVAKYRELVETLRAGLSATTQPTTLLEQINAAVGELVKIQAAADAKKKAGAR
jgi:hypothetical protein